MFNKLKKKITESYLSSIDYDRALDAVLPVLLEKNLTVQTKSNVDYIELDEKPLLSDGYKSMLNSADKGIASWYDLAKTVEDIIKENSATESLIHPCLSSEFCTKAHRQHYSPLSTKLLEDKFGTDVYTRHWREDVKMCVKNLKLIDEIDEQ